jgi:hypothetical protein
MLKGLTGSNFTPGIGSFVVFGVGIQRKSRKAGAPGPPPEANTEPVRTRFCHIDRFRPQASAPRWTALVPSPESDDGLLSRSLQRAAQRGAQGTMSLNLRPGAEYG